MKFFAISTAVTLLLAGAANAGEAQNAQRQGTDAAAVEAVQARGERVVYVCDRSEETRRSFEREYGEAKFVTAEEALNGTAETWSAPRCMTEGQAQKLTALMTR